MSSKWNSHQRHKFLRAEASRDILKLLKSRKWCHVVSSEYMQDWEQCRQNVPGVPRQRTIWTFHRSKPVWICVHCHSKVGNGCFTVLLDGAYFLLAVMVEGCESSRRFWPATGPYWQPCVVRFYPWFKCFSLFQTHYHTPKQRKIKLKPRIILNYNIHVHIKPLL